MGLSPVRALLNNNQLEDAVPICNQFEVLSTSDNDSFLACAWVFYRIDRVDLGDRMVQRARNTASLPEYRLLSAFAQLKKKQFDVARSTIKSLASEYSDGPFGLQVQEVSAELYEATGQLDTAAFIYKQIVSRDPKRARAHWGLGRYYLARNDLARARTHLETTARLWPKHMGCRYNLGVVAMQVGSLGEAGKWFAQAYRLNRADPGLLEQLGLLFEKKHMIAEAVKYWQRAVDVSKNTAIAREKLKRHTSQIIDNLIEAKRYDQALAQLDGMVRAGTRIEQASLKRGIILRHLGRFDEAASELRLFLRTSPKNALAIRELGICQLNIKQTDAAQKTFYIAIELEPNNGIGYAWLAFTLEARGRLVEARDTWRHAVRLLSDPEDLQKANLRIAALQARLGQERTIASGTEQDELPSRPTNILRPPAGSGIQVPTN